jgi:hypothetical protein
LGTFTTSGAAADRVNRDPIKSRVFLFAHDAFEPQIVGEIWERGAVFDRGGHWRVSASRRIDLRRCADQTPRICIKLMH